jgi:hypothetical protein
MRRVEFDLFTDTGEPRISRNGPSLRRCPKGYAYAKFNGRKINFGRFDDPDAQGRFDSLRARWLLNDRELPGDGSLEQTTAYSVQELCDGFLGHLHKRHDKQWLKNNLSRVEQALKPLRALFGAEEAAAFSPKRLTSVRDWMIESDKLCRSEINSRVRLIRRAFKWAVAEEKVPPSVAHGIEAVEHLKRGDFGTREGREVRPVDRSTVDATLPHLSKPVALSWI